MVKIGYTHYFCRVEEIDQEKFSLIVEDFKKLLPLFKVLDIPLAGWDGEGEPTINDDEVRFNGSVHCGHEKKNIPGIPWASAKTKMGVAPKVQDAIVDTWFAGVVLDQRACPGDCSYETFTFERSFSKEGYRSADDEGRLFSCCKTAFRPYDLVVQAFLVIAKHYLGDDIKVSSDGEMENWLDAVQICQNAFGYGLEDFRLGDEED